MNEQKITPKGVVMWQGACLVCGNDNGITLPAKIFPQYCMQCGSAVIYSKMDNHRKI